ncbi:hypothetical protein [Litorimonas sp. WD9-15]|uniref:hypothetical protein n=1 Tax=Litorimonas sp. WD9-15 TaxID=3418716 RepID=UPI003D055308
MRILSLFAVSALLSTPVFAADLGTYRPGTPYSSSVAGGADVCESHCSGDAQCRAWNYVKPNPRVSGVCEFLSSASTPIASQISISGEGFASTLQSSRMMTGGTNTVRVGTQVQSRSNTVKVGQPTPTRRVVREAVPQRPTAQQASTRRLENMSLTEQQNRYRQPAASQPVQSRQPAQPRPAFRPILDGVPRAFPQSVPQPQRQYQPQPYQQSRAVAQPRRATGPRRVAPPQYQPQSAARPQSVTQSRPPIGQPIQAPANMPRRSVIAPQTAAPARDVNPIALAPEQAQKSLFGRLNDDVKAAPSATPAPTTPVTTQPMPALAGGR